MGTIIGLANLVAMAISMAVYYNRAGLRRIRSEYGIDWREFLLPNLGFFALTVLKTFGWVAVLIVWLVRDRPDSPWQATLEVAGRPARKVRRVG